MTDIMTSQNIDLSSWDTLYNNETTLRDVKWSNGKGKIVQRTIWGSWGTVPFFVVISDSGVELYRRVVCCRWVRTSRCFDGS